MWMKTFEDAQRQKSHALVREVLSDDYFSFSYKNFSLTESESITCVKCDIIIVSKAGFKEMRGIAGTGKGPVDALFNALIAEYSGDCVSLDKISVEEFYIFVDTEDLRQRRNSGQNGSDAMVKTCLTVDNRAGTLIPFRSQRRSVISAIVDVVFEALEFFINSERAMRLLHMLVKDARGRRRIDLLEEYTLQMAELVKNASYIETLQEEE